MQLVFVKTKEASHQGQGVKQNMPSALAVMNASGHITDGHLFSNSDVCLLKDLSDGVFYEISKWTDGGGLKTLDEEASKLEGGYGHWNAVKKEHVRQGKCTNRASAERNLEHGVEAMKDNPTRAFYRAHPSKESKYGKDSPHAVGLMEDFKYNTILWDF